MIIKLAVTFTRLFVVNVVVVEFWDGLADSCAWCLCFQRRSIYWLGFVVGILDLLDFEKLVALHHCQLSFYL
jgi:hypothetical protein